MCAIFFASSGAFGQNERTIQFLYSPDTMHAALSASFSYKLIETDQPQACTTTQANDNCANATALTIGGSPTSGSTCNATLETGELTGCATGNQSTWYKFIATATTLYFSFSQNSGGCFASVVLWNAPAGCPVATGCNEITCQSATNGPIRQDFVLNNLTISTAYYAQILYSSGGPCGTNATYFVWVSTTVPSYPTNPAMASCQSPQGTICSFSYNPTTTDVLNNCTANYNTSSNDSVNKVVSFCGTFTTGSYTQIAFQNLIESTCGAGGNVAWFQWKLYDTSCNLLACGDLSNVSASGLSCNTTYRLCYQWENLNCFYTRFWPYVYATNTTCGLPIELVQFSARYEKETGVNLFWMTASEINNQKFVIERSTDGELFEAIAEVPGKGTASNENSYSAIDRKPASGVSYYRLNQMDFDGKHSYSPTRAVYVPIASGFYQDAGRIIFTADVAGTIQLVNMLGQTAENIHMDAGTRTLGEALAPGAYVLLFFPDNADACYRTVFLK